MQENLSKRGHSKLKKTQWNPQPEKMSSIIAVFMYRNAFPPKLRPKPGRVYGILGSGPQFRRPVLAGMGLQNYWAVSTGFGGNALRCVKKAMMLEECPLSWAPLFETDSFGTRFCGRPNQEVCDVPEHGRWSLWRYQTKTRIGWVLQKHQDHGVNNSKSHGSMI